jgi:hypothetical protein
LRLFSPGGPQAQRQIIVNTVVVGGIADTSMLKSTIWLHHAGANASVKNSI